MATAEKKKKVLWLPSSRSDWHVLQRRCKPTPTPIFIMFSSVGAGGGAGKGGK